MFCPRISSSPVPSGPTASRRTSTTGAGNPTESAWATNSCGRKVDTLAVSVIERTREVGLLRAIGVSRPQLRSMITLESVVIAVLGALLGVALGIGFGVALMYAVRDQGLEVISVPFVQLAIFLVLSIVIGVLAAVFPARRAARLDVLRAIATE